MKNGWEFAYKWLVQKEQKLEADILCLLLKEPIVMDKDQQVYLKHFKLLSEFAINPIQIQGTFQIKLHRA